MAKITCHFKIKGARLMRNFLHSHCTDLVEIILKLEEYFATSDFSHLQPQHKSLVLL